jgi:hypothetical protein
LKQPKVPQSGSPAGIVEHLRRIHKEKPETRKQVQEFVAGILWKYD